MQVIGGACAATLREFLLAHVEPGSVVSTDGFPSYPSACAKDYVHRPTPISGSGHQAHELLPGVHRQTLNRGHSPRSGEPCLGPVLSQRVLLPLQAQALAS